MLIESSRALQALACVLGRMLGIETKPLYLVGNDLAPPSDIVRRGVRLSGTIHRCLSDRVVVDLSVRGEQAVGARDFPGAAIETRCPSSDGVRELHFRFRLLVGGSSSDVHACQFHAWYVMVTICPVVAEKRSDVVTVGSDGSCLSSTYASEGRRSNGLAAFLGGGPVNASGARLSHSVPISLHSVTVRDRDQLDDSAPTISVPTAATPRLVLVFDDGVDADHEQVRPVLADAGVEACFAVVPDWVGEDGHLNADRVPALADAGHEIAAHGRRHRYLQAHRLRSPVAAGDERLPLAAGRVYPDEGHGVLAGDEFEVADGDRTERFEIDDVRSVDGGPAVVAADPLDGGFEPPETVVRPTLATVRDEVVGAGEELASIGVDPDTFVLPYDAADVRAWRVVRDRYDRLLNAAVRSLPNPSGTARTNLRRFYAETDRLTRREIADYLDAVADRSAIGILAGHAARETLPPERVAWTIEAATARGIEVVPPSSLGPDDG